MGQGASGLSRRRARRLKLTVARAATISELEDWEQSGAMWRPLELSASRAVVELCTCYGERVDVVESNDPELIEFVRAHRDH